MLSAVPAGPGVPSARTADTCDPFRCGTGARAPMPCAPDACGLSSRGPRACESVVCGPAACASGPAAEALEAVDAWAASAGMLLSPPTSMLLPLLAAQRLQPLPGAMFVCRNAVARNTLRLPRRLQGQKPPMASDEDGWLEACHLWQAIHRDVTPVGVHGSCVDGVSCKDRCWIRVRAHCNARLAECWLNRVGLLGVRARR